MPGGAGGGASGGGSDSQPQSWEGPSLSPRRGSLDARGRGGALSRGSKDALAASELRGSGLAGRPEWQRAQWLGDHGTGSLSPSSLLPPLPPSHFARGPCAYVPGASHTRGRGHCFPSRCRPEISVGTVSAILLAI